MARPRSSATELARLLDAADQPVYVLDEEQVIVFCNRACLEWVGKKPEELLGQRCTYQSGGEASGAEAVAAGLCPPPSAWTGGECVGIIASTATDGRLMRRSARFLPLRDDEQRVVGIVALACADDVSESEALTAAAQDSEVALLHERLRSLRRQLAARYGLDRLVGGSPGMHRVRARVELAAAARASVLIVGPPGSGRQHVAGAIHHAAPVAAPGPLIPLACSVLGPELIHSTVLALATKSPLEGLGGQGTLLLNDADQIPLEVQADLTATLCGKSFPMRVIATARRPLEDVVREGKYRADLAAVLSTIAIDLPPLAQRRGDVPILAQRFVEEINARSAKQLAGFTSEALDRLDAYGWPGNLDELATVVAEAHQRAEGPHIGPGDLPQRIHWAADAAAHPRRVETTIVLDEFLGRVELELIRRALARAKGNKTKAAKLLGMTRPRLYRRMVQLGLVEGTRDEGQGAREEG